MAAVAAASADYRSLVRGPEAEASGRAGKRGLGPIWAAGPESLRGGVPACFLPPSNKTALRLNI